MTLRNICYQKENNPMIRIDTYHSFFFEICKKLGIVVLEKEKRYKELKKKKEAIRETYFSKSDKNNGIKLFIKDYEKHIRILYNLFNNIEEYYNEYDVENKYDILETSLALNREIQKLPADFYTNYIKNIEAVTVADVKRVANKYIKLNNLRFIIVGKAADFVKELEQIKHNGKPLPIFYYDKYANKLK